MVLVVTTLLVLGLQRQPARQPALSEKQLLLVLDYALTQLRQGNKPATWSGYCLTYTPLRADDDLNSLTAADLPLRLRGWGFDAVTSNRLAARIADWIDSDSVTRPLGAERYGAIMPPNRPLERLAELWLLLDERADWYHTLRHHAHLRPTGTASHTYWRITISGVNGTMVAVVNLTTQKVTDLF